MKQIAILLFFVVSIVGCDSTKRLDWTQRTNQQGLEIGNTITVDGRVFGIVNYKYVTGEDSNFVWEKSDWASEFEFWVYDPADSTDDELDPSAPIGVVVCKVYNAEHDEAMLSLRDTYPETADDYPSPIHRLEIVGRVTGLEMQKTPKMADGTPPMSLRAVQLDVDRVEVIEATPNRQK